jgi:hypothetical protein
MLDPTDDSRALLDAYARATTPSPEAIERALTRTQAQIGLGAQRSSRLPAKLSAKPARTAWIVAASVASLLFGTAALAAVHWARNHASVSIEDPSYNAARRDQLGPAGAGTQLWDSSPVVEIPWAAGSERGTAPTELEAEAADAQAEPEKSADKAPPKRRRVEPTPASTPAAASDEGSTLVDESRLLGRARRALAAENFELALEWTDEHARRHPDGELTEERLLLEAVAACRGGQGTRGRAAAERLRAGFASSAVLAKVDQACTRDG